MPYNPEYLQIWDSLFFENADKKRLYSYQSFQGRDRKRQTDELFWRNSNDLGIDLTGMGLVIDNTTGEITLVFDGTGDDPPIINRWITFTDGTNSVDAASGADTFTFEGLNDATVTVDPATKKVSIDVTGGGLQNLLQSFITDNGTYTASTPTDQINILGANGVLTKFQAGNLVITGPFSHRTFTGDTGSYSASTANATFNIIGGSDISTTVSGNQVTIDFTGSAGDPSLWEEDTGVLYPKTLTHNVGIGLDNPDEKLTVDGNLKLIDSGNALGSQIMFESGAAGTLPLDAEIDYYNRVAGAFTFGNGSEHSVIISPELQNGTSTNSFIMTIGGTSGFGGGILSVLQETATMNDIHPLLLLETDTAAPFDGVPALAVSNTSNAMNFRVFKNGKIDNNKYGTGSTFTPNSSSPMVAFLGVQGNGTFVQSTSLPGIDNGASGTSTNTLGIKTITHNLGTTPTSVIVSKQFEDGAPIHAQTTGEMIEVLRGSITSTQFKVKITDNFGTPLSNKFRTVYYIVM